MKVIGAKLREIGMMVTLLSMVHMVSCEDRLDTPRPSVSEGETVEVSLCVGLADEEDGAVGGSAPVDTKSAGGTGFDVRLVSSKTTKAVEIPSDPLATAKPNRLYGLEVWQYDGSGTYKNGKSFGNVEIGSLLDITLAAMDECQLLIIARGYNGSANTVGTLSGKSFSSVQDMEVSASTIEGITDVSKINAMPYILHLPKVKVVNDGGTYKLQSPDGTDIRILLRRMATRLTLAWDNQYQKQGYVMNQILLQSIPAAYQLIPTPDESGYPSLQGQYQTIQLPKSSVSDAGNYSCWIPTVVRGESPKATSDYYRTKENAPEGSAYATFVTQNTNDIKQKLSYRVYLGGTSSQSFDLKDNTNYIYKVTMSHTGLPVNDRRVTIIDPIPASQNNNNLVPTANCFMVVPGGAFCFDPFKFQIEGDDNNPNATLKGWVDSEGGIASVRVVWQTKESGDLGDPVLGTVTSDTDHTNIVEIKKNDGTSVSKTSTLTAMNQGRIYCRVAPNTTGGSGLIAAYNAEDQIIWSWHVWVTDYKPDPLGDATVLTPVEKRKLKFTNHGSSQPPMMDRYLGAMAGYTSSDPAKTALAVSKADGMHYQWGRKDPFPGSYSEKPIEVVTGLGKELKVAPKGLLNRYKPDGINFIPLVPITNLLSLRDAYKNPTDYIMMTSAAYGWCSDSNADIQKLWNDDSSKKGVNDPCPAGWRVLTLSHLKALTSNGNISKDAEPNASNNSTVVKDGGLYLFYEQNGSGNTTFFSLPGYRRTVDSYQLIGLWAIIWGREYSARSSTSYYSEGFAMEYNRDGSRGKFYKMQGYSTQDGHVTRCVQERTN